MRRRHPSTTSTSSWPSLGCPAWRCHPTGRGWSRRSPNSTKSAQSSSARYGSSIRPAGGRRVASPAERRVSRHRLSLPTAISCSSRRVRPRRTTSRPRRCGDYPPQAGKPSRRCRCRVASRAFAPRVRPPPRWSPRSCCARRPASTRTSDCEHCARTTRCQLFCTAVIRCVTGITTSGPTTRICSTSTDHAISPRSPGTRCGRRTSTSAPMATSS